MQLNFAFSVEQTNVILSSLGQRPYAEVADTINAIHAQAKPQMDAMQSEAEAQNVTESN